MKFLYDCTDSNNKKNKCIFEDRVGGGHSDSSDDMTSFEIQKTEGFFSINSFFLIFWFYQKKLWYLGVVSWIVTGFFIFHRM